jgi:hypothetical protein
MVRNQSLGRGSLMRIEDAPGALLHVWEGAVWITQEGDERDYLVPAGKSFRVTRAGLTLVSALRASAIALTGSIQQSTKEVVHATESAAS